MIGAVLKLIGYAVTLTSSAATDAASAGENLHSVRSNGSAREKEGSVGVASGAQRKPRERTRSNVISTLLHPGPSMPVRTHRYSSVSRGEDSVGSGAEEAGTGGVTRSKTYDPDGEEGKGERDGGFAPLKNWMSV